MKKPVFDIDELVAYATLHPNDTRIFVEDSSDKGFYEWGLENLVNKQVFVYPIRAVQLDDGLFDKYAIEGGPRGAVITLAHEVKSREPNLKNQILCIVDADFDYLLNTQYSINILHITDGTSVEMYAFRSDCIAKIIAMNMSDDLPISASELINNSASVLVDLFLARAVNYSHELGMQWLPFAKRCSLNNGSIQFDVANYVRDYLNKNGNPVTHDTFLSYMEKLRRNVTNNDYRFIRGHDVCELLGPLLGDYIRPARRRLREPQVFESALMHTITSDHLKTEPLFQTLSKILK